MKKILIVNDGFPPHGWGGANTIAYLHAKELLKRGYEVRVFATTQIIGREGESKYEGIPVRTFFTDYHPRWWAYKSLNNAQVTDEFEKELKKFAPDVVHFHNIHHYFSYQTITLAKKNGAKVFLTAHDVMSFAYQKLHHFIDHASKEIPKKFNYHVPWRVNLTDARLRFNPFRNILIRGYLKKVEKVFTVSEALKQALADNGIEGNVSVVHNGIDVASFGRRFDHEALKENLGLVGSKIMLFVGRFTPDKGRDAALRALAEVSKELPEAKLLVVGFDPKVQPDPSFEKSSNELGVREKILFVGSSPYAELYRYYTISDCVAVPSVIFDSFPTVNLEAMAAGKPVVATCFGGSREAVEDDVTGYIVNPLDTGALAQKLSFLLQHPHEARAMGERGRERVRTRFTVVQMVDGYEAQYRLANAQK